MRVRSPGRPWPKCARRWGSIGLKPLLLIFLDGVGLGDEAAYNPWFVAQTPYLRALVGGPLTASLRSITRASLVVRQLDAGLGYPGLPQSATGQATLLTGVNAAAVMSGHYGPWPGPTLKGLLEAGTLFSSVVAAGGKSLLANVFPPGYYQALKNGHRVNVPVYAAQAAGLALQGLAAYRAGRAISADLSGRHLHGLDASLPVLEPEAAGRRLAEIASRHTFTFFDFWLSDTAGHRWPLAEAVALVTALDRFLAGVVAALDGVTLLVTSDHGNLEDKRVRTHTANPVPLLALGPEAGAFAEAASLLDIYSAAISSMGY